MKSRGGLKLYLLGNDDKEKRNIRHTLTVKKKEKIMHIFALAISD
jgi:hypothetical protein